MVQLYRRKGDDRLVNSQTFSSQHDANVTVLKDGGYVVVWADGSMTGDHPKQSDVKAQRFDSNGDKVGGEFIVNMATDNDQDAPFVATLASGRFVVTWTDRSLFGGDSDGTAIKGQLFEANGAKAGPEFLVNTQTAGWQYASAVTGLASGGFVVSWTDQSGVGGDSSIAVKAQVFSATAAKVGGEILVNTVTYGTQHAPSMIALPSGGFAVVWVSEPYSGGYSVALQRFDAAGAKVGGEQVVKGTDAALLAHANITALDSGFVVTWAQEDSSFVVVYPEHGSPSRTFDVRGQRFDSNGVKLGAEFVVAGGVGNQSEPDAHALPGGGFIVTWQGDGDRLSQANVFGQIYDAAGDRLDPAFVISSVTAADQLRPEVEVLPSGDIVVVWTDLSGSVGDSSASAVKSQILTASPAPPSDIALSATMISETAREGVPLAVLTTVGVVNGAFSYTLLADSSGGAFEIVGDKLVVIDNSRLDFETTPHHVDLRIRTTDGNGQSYEETIGLDIADTPEAGYAVGGDEFLVNTTTQDYQFGPTIAPLASGGFVAFWSHRPVNDYAFGKVQIFDAAGNKVGGELSVMPWRSAFVAQDLAGLPGGGFVAIWTESEGRFVPNHVEGQVYDASSNPLGGLNGIGYFREQNLPSVATFAPGGPAASSAVVLTWSEGNNFYTSPIYAGTIDSAGHGTMFRVSSNYGFTPGVAILESGNFVISWATRDGPIMGRIFGPNSTPLGFEFEVSTLAGGIAPQVAALAGGGFVVTYTGSGVFGLRAQIFDSDGVKVGSEFLISGDAATRVGSADVAALPWGGFIVSWGSSKVDPNISDPEIRAQVFDSTGQPVGAELAVNQTTLNGQFGPTLAVLASGDVVVSWTDNSGQGGDASGTGIKARFVTPAVNDFLTGDGGDNLLDGGDGDDRLLGLGGADTLEGGAGNDYLDGGTGDDAMRGGPGDDIYSVDDAGDVAEENSGEGRDKIRTSLASYSLAGTNIDDLTAITDIGHDLRGSAGDNVVTGAAGDDLLRLGDGGADSVKGGAGNDVLYFGAEFTAADAADGGEGRDVIVLQGNYTLTLTGNLTGIEALSLQSGANARWGDTAGNSYDYNITMAGANTPPGMQMIVNGQSLRVGEDFTFDGSAETGGKFLVVGGYGIDTLKGGWLGDVFFFEGDRWGASDSVDGGEGCDSLTLSAGDGLTHIEFGATSLTSIEAIALIARDPTARLSYEVVLNNANVARGAALVVDASSLTDPAQTVDVDGSAVRDGVLILVGGAGSDVLTGGLQADTLTGGTGADTMRGGPGDDVYYVDDAGDVVEEKAGEGYTDEVRTSLASYSLFHTNVENLTATGEGPHDFRGSEGNNVVTGGSGNDLLRLNDGGVDGAFGGDGNDVLYFGEGLNGADHADGGEGRDVVVLQGNYNLTLSPANLAGVESISLQSGSNSRWGDTAGNSYDYNITVDNANTPAGLQMIVNGHSLRVGEDFTFDGSAETDGQFLVFGGNGIDTLKGGAQGDVFFFDGDRWGAGDSVDGGEGRDALMISAGNGVTHIEFGATSLTSIEAISLNPRYASDPTARPSYELVLHNGNVAPGATLTVNASSLTDPAQTVSFDGSAVRDGVLIMFGGAGNDVLTGGLGADTFTGKAGADTYRYTSAAQSTAAATDQILDFVSGSDRIDLGAIDADSTAAGDQAFHWIGANAFTGGGAASAGELRAFESNGSWFVEGDTDGNGSADLVIRLVAPSAPVVQGDFLP